MKLDCGETRQTKISEKEEWHEWFAWHPVTLGDNDCRWLEVVERKGELQYDSVAGYWMFEYRSKNT